MFVVRRRVIVHESGRDGLSPACSCGTVVAMSNRATFPSVLLAAVVFAIACQGCKSDEARAPDKTAAAPAASAADPAAGAGPEALPAAIAARLATIPDPRIRPAAEPVTVDTIDNVGFRDRVVAFVRQVAAGAPEVTCELPAAESPFPVEVWIFRAGAPIGNASASDSDPCVALKEATRRAIAAVEGERAPLDDARFAINLTNREYSLLEYQGKGIELSHGVVPVRVFDKALLARRIDEGLAYLLRVINAERGGVHKYYYAPTDTFEPRLHTIYTASTIFTLLKLQAHQKDERLPPVIDKAAKYLLSMQSREPGTRSHGGFHYSLDLQTSEPERKFVVGTTSKSIFTLLELYAIGKDKKYLDAARLAADWLLTMRQPDGRVHSYLRQKPSGRWTVSRRESMLYTGQVLSALSRTFGVTRDPKYLEAAKQTTGYLMHRISQDGCYLGDEYRKANPISSSWAILSLLDYVKVTSDAEVQEVVFRCARELLGRQINEPADIYRHGRWRGSLSSSGNGWLAEVMAEVYLHCRKHSLPDCDPFKAAIVQVMRQLMQHTYSPENAFVAKNPEMATGGVFWNVADRYVRTDSVCHAMNAYVYMIDHLDDSRLIDIPEPPLSERLTIKDVKAPAPDEAATGAGEGDDEPADTDEAAAESEPPTAP